MHVPFCSAICPYCDFAVARGDSEAAERYVAALECEIGRWSAPGVAFDTLYFGGGTPSALPPHHLARIVESLVSRFRMASDLWISLEVNPEDVDSETAAAWSELGVRTVSVGVQSFDDDELRFLGRRHTAVEGRRAVERLLEQGFDVVSLDLIYALPGQQRSAWSRSLEQLPEVQHVSGYELTVHEGTPFARFERSGRLVQTPDAEKALWFRHVHEELGRRGLEAYEVSNFARGEGARSRHNSKYWRSAPYLGLGPSAHSFDGACRWAGLRDWKAWASALETGDSVVAMHERLSAVDRCTEEIMLGLRTAEGVDLEDLRERYGFELRGPRAEAVARYRAQGLLELHGARLEPTLEGWLVADTIAAELS